MLLHTTFEGYRFAVIIISKIRKWTGQPISIGSHTTSWQGVAHDWLVWFSILGIWVIVFPCGTFTSPVVARVQVVVLGVASRPFKKTRGCEGGGLEVAVARPGVPLLSFADLKMVCCNNPKAINCLPDIPWVIAEVSHYFCHIKDFGVPSGPPFILTVHSKRTLGTLLSFTLFSTREWGFVFLYRHRPFHFVLSFWLLNWLFHKYIPFLNEKKKRFFKLGKWYFHLQNLPFLLILAALSVAN